MHKYRRALLWVGLSFLTLIIAGMVGYIVLDKSQNTASKTALEQLRALKRGNFSRAYYLYTTDNYQDGTTLEEFRNWVRSYPILTDYQSAEFFGQNTRGEFATLTGELKGKEGSLIPIVYRMTKEYGEWKIDSIQLMPMQMAMAEKRKSGNTAANHENEAIFKVIQDHLLDLKYRNTRRAYDDHLSEEFKKTVPFGDFEMIVQENSELTDYDSIRFGDITDDEGLKAIQLSLISDDEIQEIQFWLAKERSGWKIWAIEVGSPAASGYVSENGNQQNGTSQTEPVSSSPVQKIKSQLEQLKKGNISQAYSDYVSQEFTQATSESDFEKFIKNYPEFTEYKSIKIESESENDGLTYIRVILTTDKGESDVDYWLSKTDGDWKIWGIRVDESAYYPPIPEEEKQVIVKVIKEQLEALRDNKDISKAYYAYISQDFQNNTSFEDFQAFLKDYPIFTEQDEVTIGHGIQEGDLRLIRIALQSEDETAEVDYRLIKQDDDWKVWGIQILTNIQDTPENEDEIKEIIESQINALKAEDISKAYYAYTSKQFQEAASFDAFKTYVEKHDEMGRNEKTDILDINFKPTFASAVVSLKGSSGDQTYLYRLVQENNQWKILSIRMMRDQADIRKNHDPLQISQVDIGTEIDLNGLVINPGTVFSPQDTEITVNVHVDNGSPGDQVEAVLEHVKTNSSIPPVFAELDKSGESVVNYVFTAPTQGWPIGLYRLHITSPSGASKTVEFNIKK